MSVSSFGLRHPVPVAIISAAAFLFGILALFSMNREFIPSTVLPTSSVVSIWPGVSAEDVERDLTSVLENYFATVSGLTDLSSESREGVSIIHLRFHENVDQEVMNQEIRSRVDQASAELPDGLHGDPLVSSWGSTDLPVFSYAVASVWDADRTSRYVDDTLLQEMYRIEGVAKVNVLGDTRRELGIQLDIDAMQLVGIVPTDVLGMIQGRNLSMGSGLTDWGGGEWAFRVSGEFRSVGDLENLVVGNSGGRPVRLIDVAEISDEYAEMDERIRSNGEDLLVVQVGKRENGNAIDISREIRSTLERLENAPDSGYSFLILHDDSDVVRQSLGAVLKSAITGILMAIAVIWLFLRNWKATLVVAISLPVSLVVALAGMKLAGLTVNVLTMAGITVSLGMIVDASIVVLESIHSRHTLGESPENSALLGSTSVASAIGASTSTSVSVFLPMIFLSGIIGIVLKDLSVALILCLASSLAAALFVVPPLAGRSLSSSGKSSRKGKIMTRIEAIYRRALERSLGMAGTVIITAATILGLSFLAADSMGLSFLPAADYAEFFVSIKLPPGSSLDETTSAADRADAYIRSQVPELTQSVFFVGMENDLSGEERRRESLWGQVILQSPNNRKRDVREIIDALNESLPEVMPGSSVTVVNGGFDRMLTMGTDGAGFRVQLRSESWESLSAAATRVEALLAGDPDIISTARNVTENRRVVSAVLNGQALGELGINARDAAFNARIAGEGMEAGDFRPLGEPDRVIRLKSTVDGRLADSSALNSLGLRTASGDIVPFDAVADLTESSGVSEIRRRDRARTLTVIGYYSGENIRGISKRLNDELTATPLRDGVEWSVKGVGGLIGDSLGKLGLVLLVALFLVYAVMAIQFERFIQPLIIMASVPFCFIGVVGGLAIFGSSLSIISFLGIVALGGIVVNNAIVQIDQINQLRRDGEELDEAVVKGAVARLRPILMTTLTTFFGVLPLSFASGAGAQIYAPLGQAIAGGLLSSTLITLFLIPVLYRSVEKRMLWKKEVDAREPNAAAIVKSGAA